MSIEPADILARVAATYAACTSYRDDGVVTTTWFDPRRRVERRPFSTRFVRDQGFLFEFRSRRGEDDWDQYAIWNENGRTRTWSSWMSERDEAESLSAAIARGTGVSGGSAFRVPHLLMPELDRKIEPARPPRVATLLEVPEAEVEDCFVLERARGLSGVEQLWIDRSTLLIRRVVQPRRVLGPPPPEAMEGLKAVDPEAAARIAKRYTENSDREPVEFETITVYEAAFNAAVLPRELVFTRPS